VSHDSHAVAYAGPPPEWKRAYEIAEFWAYDRRPEVFEKRGLAAKVFKADASEPVHEERPEPTPSE
jgi:hypothetical protein